MSKYLVYTSPARGHLFPLIPTIDELKKRGHQVRILTLSDEVERLRSLGFEAQGIAPEIQARPLDDWKAANPIAAIRRAGRTFVQRAPDEVQDLRAAIHSYAPDGLLVDINCWGGMAAAQASGLPWAAFSPYFLPFQAPGVPPWGLGLKPRRDLLGKLRDSILWWLVRRLFDSPLPQLNALRRSLGLAPMAHAADWGYLPPRLLYYTCEPFEYARTWPEHVHLVGPGVWEPPTEEPPPSQDTRPLVLVTCSSEFQNDGKLIQAALDGLSNERVRVIATSAAMDPASFSVPPNAVVHRFVPHGPLLREAVCVVCHGGMGITQKALSAGVPVCAIPFGRDQMEVARHLEVAGAGVRLLPNALTPESLRDAVRQARQRQSGARELSRAFAQAPGPTRAADLLETMITR